MPGCRDNVWRSCSTNLPELSHIFFNFIGHTGSPLQNGSKVEKVGQSPPLTHFFKIDNTCSARTDDIQEGHHRCFFTSEYRMGAAYFFQFLLTITHGFDPIFQCVQDARMRFTRSRHTFSSPAASCGASHIFFNFFHLENPTFFRGCGNQVPRGGPPQKSDQFSR
jgi:hypothetical protein